MNDTGLKKAVDFISQKMDENSSYLIELDQQNGDGDLGISMKEGFAAACRALKNSETKDLGKLIMEMSAAFNEAAPSSLGTILSIGMMGMAKALKGSEEAGVQEFGAAFLKGIEKIMDKAHSKPGEKTILDSLYPAAVELNNSKNKDKKQAVLDAARAAEAGAQSTKNMLSRHGRAAYYGEKSLGILDGGAVVGQLIFTAIYDAVCE